MFGKPPVTALQEYCAKHRHSLPKYDCIDSDDGTKSFVCSVEALDLTCYGNGRSKKEAKHDAAANLIKAIAHSHPDIEQIPQAPHEPTPPTDAVMTLRDICVQRNHPLPFFDIIQQAGPAEAPEFTVLCQLATIKRYGIANTKKAARQKAALEILQILHTAPVDISCVEVSNLGASIEEADEDRYKKLKTYRELTDAGPDEKPGELLCDRHLFFEKFYDSYKLKARQILDTDTYFETDKERVGELFLALKIKPSVKEMPSNCDVKQLFIELNLDYDVAFAGGKETIYGEIIQYFRHMM